MADPLPSVGLPEVEFVELFNASEESFNLSDWIFVNTVTEMTLPEYVMGPGSYLILCDIADEAQLQTYGPVIGIPSFPALANLEDSLTLIDNEGEILDVVDYTIEWYDIADTEDGGFTLEQKNPFSSCISGGSNWGSALTGEGGTPGAQNSIYSEIPDSTPPEIESVELTDGNELLVVFNEALDVASILTENFSLDGGVDVLNASAVGNFSVELELDVPLELATEYTLSVDNVSDCEGNLPSGTLIFEFLIGYNPEPGDLIINEIMADPDQDFPSPNVEYIELLNTSDLVLELKGCVVSEGEIEDSYTLISGEYVVLTSTADLNEFDDLENTIGILDFPSLTNSGRELELSNGDGTQLDYLEYDISWYQDSSKDDGGYSLELINPDDPCSDSGNWRASVATSGATEGEQNSVFDNSPDTIAPFVDEVIIWSLTEIEVVFNEPVDLENSGVTFDLSSETGTPEFSISEVTQVSENSLQVLFDNEVGGFHIWQIEIYGLEDCWGNSTPGTIGNFSSIDEYQDGDLIINEVLFNPVTGGSDYVEIYNISDRNISIQDWFLANVEDGEVSDLSLITDLPKVILRNSYLVFTVDKIQVIDQYPFSVGSSIVELDGMPSYNNDEGTVVLLDPEGEMVDRFDYNEDYHFELLDDLNGVSLERIRFDQATNDANNWHSAAESQYFGTPGYLNSQSLMSGMAQGSFSLDSEIFSPDNDGYQDVLSLNYELEQAGYLANIRIYDKTGRELRHWIQNELLGTQGVLNFDGIDDNGEKLRVGTYLMVVEYFDLEGNVNSEKLVFVAAQFLE